MANEKTIEIALEPIGSGFSLFKKSASSKKDYNFSDVKVLRQLLSNEKARILHVIKHQKPTSIYDLAKKVKRKLKSVNDDVKLLERFGFIELSEEKVSNRIRHKPAILADKITINFKIN